MKIHGMNGLHARIRERLDASGKSMRQASIDAGLSEDAISKLLRNPEQSQTLETIDKLAVGLDTNPAWLAYGIGSGEAPAVPPGMLLISATLLRDVLRFVLEHERVPATRIETLIDILPEALSGPPVDAVSGDPFLSFRVHFQLGERRYASPA